MVTQGFWNVREGGSWYQIFQKLDRISTPGDPCTYSTLKALQDGTAKSDKLRPIPYPMPLHTAVSYVYSLDLDSACLTVSFWHQEEGDNHPNRKLTMRCLSLDSINMASDLSFETLLQKGRNPLPDISAERGLLHAEKCYEPREIKIGHPSPLHELQYRMFMDFVYQWRCSIDDWTAWRDPSSILSRRLCIAFLRLAAWDFTISSESEMAQLPLGAKFFPGWDCPSTDVYWFHGYLVVLCEDLERPASIRAAVSRAREFGGHLEDGRAELNCILMTVVNVAFIQILPHTVTCSTVLSLLTNSSTTECSAGFRVLTYFLTSPHAKDTKRNLVSRESSSLSLLPAKVLRMVLNAGSPHDIVSFAQASLMVEDWYYSSSSSSLPQLPNMNLHQFDVSIPCCGRQRREKNKNTKEREEGVSCSGCYSWHHSECLELIENNTPEESSSFTCPNCRRREKEEEQAGVPRPPLIPGGIVRASRRAWRTEGCRVVMEWNHEKVLQLRLSPPYLRHPQRWKDPYQTWMPSNQIDYVLLFGGMWSGLAFGLDDIGCGTRK